MNEKQICIIFLIHFKQAQKATKFEKRNSSKRSVMVTVMGHSFQNSGKTITAVKYYQQIAKMHWKLEQMCQALINKKVKIKCK